MPAPGAWFSLCSAGDEQGGSRSDDRGLGCLSWEAGSSDHRASVLHEALQVQRRAAASPRVRNSPLRERRMLLGTTHERRPHQGSLLKMRIPGVQIPRDSGSFHLGGGPGTCFVRVRPRSWEITRQAWANDLGFILRETRAPPLWSGHYITSPLSPQREGAVRIV